VPVLVTHGREDEIVLPSMADCTVQDCPAAVASWYEGVGHMPFVEDAEPRRPDGRSRSSACTALMLSGGNISPAVLADCVTATG
jgi:pimeloyl-ACP methyl ester carboxylesterase